MEKKFNENPEVEEAEAEIVDDTVLYAPNVDKLKFNKEPEVEEVSESLFEPEEVEEQKSSKLSKREEQIVRDLKIEVPPQLREQRTKVQLAEYWRAILVALVTIAVYFLFFKEQLINIWYLRAFEIILVGGIIYLSERLFKRFKKTDFMLLLEIILYTFMLLISSEMTTEHALFNGNTLLILSFCYILYYIGKASMRSRTIYVEYMRSRSDVREILKDSRKSYI